MDAAALREQVFEAALPLLEGHKVTDLVVGLSLTAVEVDGEKLAVSYVLRESLGGGCSIFPYASQAVGMSAVDVGRWFVTGKDDLQRALGATVLTAVSEYEDLKDSGSRERPFDLSISPADTIGMVGNIRPVVKQLRPIGCPMIIFDKGKCARGNPAENVFPMEDQPRLLPECDIVFLSGTTMINGTAAELFSLCSKAREVVLLGSSVPMVAKGYGGTPVSVLAGSWWREEDKEVLFRNISMAAGMQTLGRYMIKKSVRIR